MDSLAGYAWLHHKRSSVRCISQRQTHAVGVVCFVLLLIASFAKADYPVPLLRPMQGRSEVEQEHVQAAALIMEARILERREESIAALRKYQRAWRLDRDARVALKQIVPLALKLGRVDEATRYALLLTNSDLKDPFLAERLAMLMADQLEYDRSLQLYRHVLRLRNEEFEEHNPIAMHFEMGRLYFLSKQYEQAAQSFHVVLDAIDNPDTSKLDSGVRSALLSEPDRLYTLFAESFLEAREYELAWKLFERASDAKKEEEAGWLQLQQARVDYRAGRYAAAQEKLEAYVKQKLSLGGRTPYELLQTLLEKTLVSRGGAKGAESKRGEANAKEANPEQQRPSTSADADAPAKRDRPGILASFRDWLTNDPDNFPLLSYVAEITRRDGGLDDAAQMFEKSVATQPTLEGYVGLMKTYRELGDASRLLDVISQTLLELETVPSYEEEVRKVILDRKLLHAMLDLIRERVENRSATQAEIATGGFFAIDAQDYESADEFWNEAAKHPDQLDLLVAWGVRYLASGEAGRAVAVFRAALDCGVAEEDSAPIRYYLAGALQLAGETEEALAQANRAAELAKDVPDIAVRPAWILYNAKRNEEAYERYKSWLDKFAEDYSVPGIRESVRDARFVMSNICLEQQRTDEAIEWLEQILDEYPEDVGALNDLGYLMVDQNKCLARATAMIRMAVEAEPDNVAYRDSLGWALFRVGEHAEAIEHLRMAASAEEPDPIILDHLGDALLANGDELAATTTWRLALKSIGQRELTPAEEELKRTILQKLHQPVE